MNNQEDTNVTPIQTAKFLLHAKKYGIHYAVGFLVVEQLGIIGELSGYVGGMC